MIGAADRYLELMTNLLLTRAFKQGGLSEEEEATYADELDRCWWAMTATERDVVERLIAEPSTIEAPPSLDETDTEVSRGAKEPPRRRIAA